MRFLWRGILVLAVGIVVGVAVSDVVMAHELVEARAPFAEVRLASWMAGLCCGSLAAVLVGIAVTIRRRR